MSDHAGRYLAAEGALWARYGVASEVHWVSVPATGTRIRVQETGDGPPVLFLHGVLLAAAEFAPLVGGLAGLRSVLVDLPGSGLSDAVPGPAPGGDPAPGGGPAPAPWFVDLLERVLDERGLDRVAVVGHSFGGACALWLAAARPDRVSRIALEGCPALVEGERLPLVFRLLATGALGRFLGRRGRLYAHPRRTMAMVGHAASTRAGRIDRAWLDWYRSLALDTATMSGGAALLQQIATGGGFRRDLTFGPDALRAIAQPTLFLWGEDDPMGGPDVGRRAAAAMPGATFRSFAGSGHLPWLDDPAEHARLVRAFVAQGPDDRPPADRDRPGVTTEAAVAVD